MAMHDPYLGEHSSSESTYECVDCHNRVVTDADYSHCPECGGDVKNIAVPQE